MSTWLTDSTANRYVQTYFKNFIELSGNFIVHNSDYVDISDNITLKNGAYLRFPDGSVQTTANTGGIVTLPTDISFSNVDISKNLLVKGNTTLVGQTTINTGLIVTGGTYTESLYVNTGINCASINSGSIYSTGQLDTGTMISSNGSFLSGGNPQAMINVGRQGANIGWNSNNGFGRMDLINTKPSGIEGGFDFYNINLAATITNPIFKISGAGAITSNGITDTGTASFNNVSISGTFTLPSTISATNLNVTNLLTVLDANVTDDLTANKVSISGTLKVVGVTTVNGLQVLSNTIISLPTVGVLQGAPITSTQFAYVNPIGLPAVGDFIGTPAAAGMTNTGVGGSSVTAVNTTNRIVTFNTSFGTVPDPLTSKQVYGYASSSTVIQTFNPKSVAVNDVCAPVIASPNKPYVSALSGANKTITLAGASLTPVTSSNTTGVYDALSRLISNAMPPLGTLFGSLSTTSQIDTLITPKYATIVGATNTPTTIAATVTGYAKTSTQLNVVFTTSVAVGQFIRNSQLDNDFTQGTTVSAFNATDNTITFNNGTLSSLGGFNVVEGYIPAAGSQINTNTNTLLAVNKFVEGAGIPAVNNRIKAHTSYVCDISSTTLVESAFTTFNGYIKTGPFIVAELGTTLITNRFLQGTGFGSNPSRVGSLSSPQTYNISFAGGAPSLSTSVAFNGVALNSTQFYYTTAVTPVIGDFLGHFPGSRIIAVDTVNKIVTCNSITPVTPAFTRVGYISGANTIQLAPDANYTGIVAGQFITGGGLSLTTPFSSAINATTKTITMTATQTLTAITDVSGIILNDGTTRYFVTKVPVSATTYFSGANVDSISRTIGSTTDTYHQYIAITTPSLQTAAYATGRRVYPISSTKIIYDVSAGVLTNNSFLNTTTESSKYGAYISGSSGCDLTIANSQIPALTPTTVYGRILKSGVTNYLYYQYAPSAVNSYAYNADVTAYSNGGFVTATAVGGYSRATIDYKNQSLVTNTPVVKSVNGYVSSSGILFLNITDADRTAINALAIGSIVELTDSSSNQLKNAWFSSPIADFTYNLPTLNSSNADPAYNSSPNIKTYSLVAQSRATSTKTTIYVQKLTSGVANIAVNDFIDFYQYTTYTTGAVVATVTTYTDAIGTYYGVTLKNKYWTQTFIGSLDIAFITGSAVNIYRRDTFQVYAPTVNNTSAYTMSNYACKQEQTFSFLNPTNDFKYTGASYKSYTPISFSLYNSLTFSLSAPITITYFQPTTYNFYNGGQITTFVKNKNIYLPVITATDDTFCTLNLAQTLTNKTLTAPTINTPTITAATINTSLSLFGNSFLYIPWTSALSTFNVASIGAFITGSVSNPTFQTTGGAAQYIYQVIGKQLTCKVMIVHGTPTTGAAIGGGAYQLLLPNSYTISNTVAAALVPTIDANTDIVLQATTTTNGVTGTQIGRGYIRPNAAANWNINIMDIYAVSSTRVIAILASSSASSIWGSAFGFTTLVSQNFTFEFSVPIV